MFAALSFLGPLSAFAQADFSAISFSLAPGVYVPLDSSAELFGTGAFAALRAEYKPPVAFPMTFQAVAFADGGYYRAYAIDDDGSPVSGGNAFWDVGGELGFFRSPRLSLNAGGFYRRYRGVERDLAYSAGAYIGTAYRFPISGDASIAAAPGGAAVSGKLKIESISASGIFPAFYQYYDDHPIGVALVRNGEKAPIEGLRVSVFIHGFMDAPKAVEIPDSIPKGASVEVPLYALLNRAVLDIIEGTKAAAEFRFDYSVRGEPRTVTKVETVRIENRNASVWDDDRRAAAFVTAKDPAVLKFAKNIASALRDVKEPGLDANLRVAAAVHAALSLHGLVYTVDPKTPYAKQINDKSAIDFLQFPRRTLEYKAGDCDDLSILYAALFESLSIDAAFITVPGHIFVAVALGLDDRDAQAFFASVDGLIVRDGRVWLPIAGASSPGWTRTIPAAPRLASAIRWRSAATLSSHAPRTRTATATVPIRSSRASSGASTEPAASDFFSWGLASDGAYILAGAPYANSGDAVSGGAYLYSLDGDGSTALVQALSPSDSSGIAGWGCAIAVSGGIAMIGATDLYDDASAGSVYVFE